MNPRARNEIKALAEVGKEALADGDAGPAGLFMSGLLTGLAMAVRIDEGATAEQQLEDLNNQLAAAVGQAYLAGHLPGQQAKGGNA